MWDCSGLCSSICVAVSDPLWNEGEKINKRQSEISLLLSVLLKAGCRPSAQFWVDPHICQVWPEKPSLPLP